MAIGAISDRLCYMLACHTLHSMTILGLPLHTVLYVGATVVLAFVLLIIWGLRFQGDES